MHRIVAFILMVVALLGCTGRDSMSDIRLSSEGAAVTDPSPLVAALGQPLLTGHDRKPAVLKVFQLADLWLPSGQVTASDGFIMQDPPFSRRVPPGRHPLFVVIARLGDDERVAFAVLRFSDTPVAKWEMAVTEGQDAAMLGKDEIFGYGVDSGTGCFCDPAAQKLIDGANDPQMKFFDRVSAEMDKVDRGTWSWVHIETARGSAALFSSGFGDGCYASYFGLDGTGKVSALVTDFGVIDWPARP